MKKAILDHYSWTFAYSIYHPVFYSCIKTNYTPIHVNSWPMKKIYNESKTFLEFHLEKSEVSHEKGNFQAYQWANQYNFNDESQVSDHVLEKGRTILLKRFAKRNDLVSLSNLLSNSDVSSQDYYLVASTIIKEGSLEELLQLLEKGLESKIPPKIGILLKIFEKAVNLGHQKACTTIWNYFSLIPKDFRLERAVLLKLNLVKNDQELFSVFQKAKEWSVLSPRVKTGILQTAKRFSSKFEADWKFRLFKK